MKKIVCFGELMLSLEPDGYRRFVQADEFHVFYTGAESNVCASLAQFGMNAQFVTRLPENEIADSAVASLWHRHGLYCPGRRPDRRDLYRARRFAASLEGHL